MIDISFIEDIEPRDFIESDIYELKALLSTDNYKSTVVMIGSILESLLIYYIESHSEIKAEIENYDKRKIGLSDALGFARNFNLISQNLYLIASNSVQETRNSIHPKVQKRIGKKINKQDVEICYNVLVEISSSLRRTSIISKKESLETIIKNIFFDNLSRDPSKVELYQYSLMIEKYIKGSINERRNYLEDKMKNTKLINPSVGLLSHNIQ